MLSLHTMIPAEGDSGWLCHAAHIALPFPLGGAVHRAERNQRVDRLHLRSLPASQGHTVTISISIEPF